ERILGPNHPHTLTSRNNLADAYYAAGDLERAIALLQANLTDTERILAPNHPNTLVYRNNLSRAKAVAGVPLDDKELVDYWLGTHTWAESFAVLDAAEKRLRGQVAKAILRDRAGHGDSVAAQHMLILTVAEVLPRDALFATVTNSKRAIQAAIAAADAGQFQLATFILGVNLQARNHPVGLALPLATMVAGGEPQAASALAARIRSADAGSAVADALGVIAPTLTSDAMRAALPVARELLAAAG
ncbi:MAG: tetratricopeptide repeat protein, partial [Candidatus Nanopelagicales bacterium]